ncbi:hypothetical protein DOY81_000072 [Sarcophaga bullata]|nr:hypothetical protein DOY81_000072 [Sarcophaga bullata]
MWNPTPSSSTASSSDNKQNVREQAEVDDCKCSGGGIEHLNQHQQQSNNSKHKCILLDRQEVENYEKKLSDLSGETIDSGFISGPQTSSSAYFEEDNEGQSGGGEIKILNIPESTEHQLQQKEQDHQLNLDSGIIEEDFEGDDCYLQEQNQSLVNSIKQPPNMLLPNSVESGISEWFCNLSLDNNPNAANINTLSSASNSRTNPSMTVAGTGLNNLGAPKQQQTANKPSASAGSTAQQTATISQQITLTNAWEKFYQQNDDGDTPLHLACISGNVDVVAALIRMARHPCLFNIQNDEAQTPLHLATLTAQPKIIRMLLIAGAEPTIRDRHGNTALHLACISGEEQCVRALTIPLSASEVHEAHRQYGHRANDKSYLKCAQLPSDLEIRNYDGERCVHLAAQAGFINILRILVLYGADINAREGKSGRTPLHIAIECCNEDLANYLLDDCQKLNLETATYAGLTAYQVACILNKSEMQDILEKRGAEPITPPDSDYDSSDIEIDLDDSKLYNRFGDPGYFVGYNGGNAMTVA